MNYITNKYKSVLDVLEDVMARNPDVPTLLMVCSTRDAFMAEVLGSIDRDHERSCPTSPPPEDEGQAVPHNFIDMQRTRILNALTASQSTRIIFCPRLTVLRGYLSATLPKPDMSPLESAAPTSGTIIVLNPLALHYGTSEFTVQGLSRTFANVVSSCHRAKCRLTLAECKNANELSEPGRGPALWDAQVPLLSERVRLGEAGSSWGTRTISVRRLASRWFRFEDGIEL